MIIELPYPNKDLMPNRKNGKHWASTKSLKDSSFNTAFYLAKQAIKGVKFNIAPITLTLTFVQSDKRKRDLDNLLANGSVKAYIDAIAKVIGVDDVMFEPIIIKRGYNKLQSATILELQQV